MISSARPMTNMAMPPLMAAEAGQASAAAQAALISVTSLAISLVAPDAGAAAAARHSVGLIYATTWKSRWKKPHAVPANKCGFQPMMSVTLATVPVQNPAPRPPPARLAADTARCVCSRASSPFSKLARAAMAAARVSIHPAEPVAEPVASSSIKHWKSRFQPVSARECACVIAAMVRPACTAHLQGIYMWKYTSNRTACSSVMAMICIAKCRSALPLPHWAVKLKSPPWMEPHA